MFNPFFRIPTVDRVDRCGIPVTRTIYVNSDTTNNTVTYGLCPFIWEQLPNEGILLMHVQHSPAAGISASAPVLIDPTKTSSSAGSSSSSISSGGKPLINGSGDQMVNNEVTASNRYFVYYNKCQGIFQAINHIIPAATPAE